MIFSITDTVGSQYHWFNHSGTKYSDDGNKIVQKLRKNHIFIINIAPHEKCQENYKKKKQHYQYGTTNIYKFIYTKYI